MRDAFVPGAAAPQPGYLPMMAGLLEEAESQGEDCLNLNVSQTQLMKMVRVASNGPAQEMKLTGTFTTDEPMVTSGGIGDGPAVYVHGGGPILPNRPMRPCVGVVRQLVGRGPWCAGPAGCCKAGTNCGSRCFLRSD
ncbi:hypothetical protein, partial [Streptomyces sp. NPDC059409]|uniref:hypothetical protein n=1 Tax=Streptomyces sp. NPDC059409 TaxID=3346824 RepID=UPI003687CC3C